ncbi:MAG TPA: glycoside hydrolase family 20 [Porphyromonadaceae bacterium]|nr:glycoside hydrolase family 20 [Porphyromonadaceae bacterium]
MNIKLIYLFCLAFCLPLFGGAQELPIVPKPLHAQVKGGDIALKNGLRIYLDPDAQLNKLYISSIFYELGIQTSFTSKSDADLVVKLNEKASPSNEGYRLTIGNKHKNRITAEASTKNGLLYALQSLRQIIKNDQGKFSVPVCTIEDEPAFPWRAFMLDESRHFHGMHVVKGLLDEMARLKLNIFHWHLVDDPGWRIEIKQYPELTTIGSKRDFSHKQVAEEWDKLYPNRKMFYTQDEISEIVRYAADRGIQIMPEIEVPGHASAAIYAYPWLGSSSRSQGYGVWGDLYNVTDPKVEEFLHHVLDEVIALFPSKLVHIGGDEANYTHWQNNPEIVAFMKENNIPTFSDLQVWSINRFSRYLSAKGVRMMGWNEITGDNIRGEEHMQASRSEQLAPGTIVHFWDGDISLVNKAIEKGYDVVNSNRHFTYLDYGYDRISLQQAYSFDPIPEGLKKEDEPKILGLGCQMWGEYTPNTARVYYQTFPRIAAYAESGWTSRENKDYEDFIHRFRNLKTLWMDKGFLKDQPHE